MNKMVDLKREKSDEPKAVEAPNQEDYPYGLTVHLDHHSLKKLGVHTLPKAGDKLHLTAHAHVKSVEERHEDGGKKRRHMTLELRKMALEHKKAEGAEKTEGARAAMDEALSDKSEGSEDEE